MEKLVCRCEEVGERFANAVGELQLDLNPPLSGETPHFPSVPVTEAQKILWELTELNFHFELLALDKRASSSHRNKDGRQAMVLQSFTGASLFVTDPAQANADLQSCDWRWEGCHFLLALKALIRDWDGVKPRFIL